MGMERLLPTGKQLFVCDHFFQGDIAWEEFSWMRQKYTKKKKKKKKKTVTTTTTRNKQTQNFHYSSWGNFYGLNKNPQLNQSRKVKWHENNFKKHLPEKFLKINASRKHFSIKDIFIFLSRLYCTN